MLKMQIVRFPRLKFGQNKGVAKGGVSRSSWTKKFFEVVIWPIEQQINHDLSLFGHF